MNSSKDLNVNSISKELAGGMLTDYIFTSNTEEGLSIKNSLKAPQIQPLAKETVLQSWENNEPMSLVIVVSAAAILSLIYWGFMVVRKSNTR